MYFCTCCHQEKKSRKQIVYFKLKNYDFGNKVVSNALAGDIYCKKSLFEYICRVCHQALHIGRGSFPIMPPKAIAKMGKICKECQKNNSRYNTIKEKLDILKSMKSLKKFQFTCKVCENIVRVSKFSFLEGNRHLHHYNRDALAHLLVQDDCPVHREEAFPVYTKGDGNCFLYSLS